VNPQWSASSFPLYRGTTNTVQVQIDNVFTLFWFLFPFIAID
jgi:hypothetical protein